MKYKIKYNYDTGNSFHTDNGLEEYLDLEHDDINIAKSNLKRIEEHYSQYKSLNGYSDRRNFSEVFKENEEKDWFVKNGSNYQKEYCFLLMTDKGKMLQMSAPWCGYFESLNSVEIEENNSDMKITF
ncbi:MAG: hypothetical protein JWQ09_5036 [Segetibacter sp.]|nr:hypothetical protein [Segetibacter sp.]